MLPGPLELNPAGSQAKQHANTLMSSTFPNSRQSPATFVSEAPKGAATDFPQLIFSARAVPKWKVTLSGSSNVFEILRLESNAHYVEVAEGTQLASSLPLRSFGQFGFSSAAFGAGRASSSFSILDFSSFGFALTLRAAACLDFVLLICSMTCMEASVSTLDCCHAGFFVPIRSPSRPASLLFAFGFQTPGSSPTLHGAHRLDSLIPLVGSLRPDAVSAALDSAHLELFSLIQSFS